MKKIFSFFAAMLVVFAANATIRNITPTHCFEGDRADGYTLYVELARGAQAGDTIVLADGTYNENQSIPVSNQVVVMAAENAHPVVVMNGYFQIHASAEFKGIKFQCKEGGQGYCMYFYENNNKFLKLDGCEFQDFTQYTVSSWEAYHIDSCIVNNCYFHNLSKAPFYFAPSSLPNDVNACDNLTVNNSTFANITLADVAVLDLRNNNNNANPTSKLRVDHCTFYNCKGYERMIQAYKSPDVLVSNCIMMNPLAAEEEASIYATYLYGGDVKNCVWFQTKRVYTKKEGGDVDNQNVDPLFVDAANGDFTLGANSPALTAGLDGGAVGDPRWVPAVAPAHTYTVAGNLASVFGETWNPELAANDMELQSDGSYKWEKTDLALNAGSIEFKVCQDHDWNPAYPSQNYVLNIAETGTYTITITFDPANNNNVSAVATKTGTAEVDPSAEIKGGWDNWATAVALTLAADKKSASCVLNITAAAEYEFKMILNGGEWRGNGYTFHRDFNAAAGISANGDNMVIRADVAGEYTITWVFANDSLNIAFPAAAPVAKFKIAGSMSAEWAPSIESFEDSYTFENLAAGNHKFKVVDGSDWLGFSALTEADRADELYTDQDGNVCFTLAQAGDVVVTYIKDQVFKVEGDFVLPTVQLIGIGGWDADENAITLTAAQDKKSASVTLNLDGSYYEFKMIVGGAWLGKENAEGLYGLHREWTSVDGLTYAGGNIKLTMDAQDIVPGAYTFTWEYVTGKLTVTFPTPAPTGITWELNGGAVLPKGCDTNEELWEAFKPDYNAFYNAGRADQPITKVSTFVQDNPGSKSMMMSETSGWKWLGDYLIASCADQGDESWDLSAGTDQQWRMTLHSFFNKEDKTNWPMGNSHALFSEAGKEEHWLAAYAEMVLPESVSAEYTLPAVYKADAEFGGWYDNAEFSGEALTVIPANYAGTLYAKWVSPSTNIENTAVDAKVVKLIENGKLIIIRNGVRYNAQGQME